MLNIRLVILLLLRTSAHTANPWVWGMKKWENRSRSGRYEHEMVRSEPEHYEEFDGYSM